jgi:hypothetical protein
MVKASRFIVITSIFAPTRAVRAFANWPSWQLVVAGDRKSPAEWQCGDAIFLSIDRQAALGYRLARSLPQNHYCRKNLAYLHAIANGASVIVDTDDDNVPKADWDVPTFEGTFRATARDLGFVNVYRSFTAAHIWPRGFPLRLLRTDAADRAVGAKPEKCRVGIWQGLADDDPDVDAIYRMVVGARCFFDPGAPLVLAPGTLCPFNSQNTAFVPALFPLLYLPVLVSFRFTDILRGLVAQPIMWLYGYSLGFTAATVVQERNPHNLIEDFRQEIPCYLHSEDVVNVVSAALNGSRPIEENLYAAYEALVRREIVPRGELAHVEAWIADLAALRAGPTVSSR